MAKNKKAPVLPSLEDERDLLSVIDADGDTVSIRGRNIYFGRLNGFGQRKITRIMLGKGREDALSCKCVAAARLNGYFKIKLFWSILWRWYFYIRQYTESELADAAALIKKKAQVTDWLANTILWIGIRETTMQMNREEVFLSLQERSGGKDGNSAKRDNGSLNHSE